MKRDLGKYLAWKRRSKGLQRGQRKPKRALEEVAYSFAHKPFIDAHSICPVTGERTTQVHHSAKREGRWLNLQRYWIAVSAEGHQIIEDNKAWAESVGLMVRVRQSASEHIAALEAEGVNLFEPIFYQRWDGRTLVRE